jgi:hypothetical protein
MKDEYITLIPTPVAGNTIQWTMIHDGDFGQGQNYPSINLQNDGPSQIKFTIVDLNSTGITFDGTSVDSSSNPKAINAIWIVEGSTTNKAPGAYPTQVNKVQLQNTGKELVVKDKNSDDAVLRYQLNFKPPANSTLIVPPIDPEIRNNGGGRGFDLNMDAVAAVLGLVVLGLVGLLWVSHFRKRS